MDLGLSKPKHFQRQCSDTDAFIATHSIEEYHKNFPIIDITKNKKKNQLINNQNTSKKSNLVKYI